MSGPGSQFIDGPAAGKSLLLRRTPIVLRVVRSTGEHPKIDALDQPDDTPRDDEALFLYVLIRSLGWVHLRAAGGRGGRYATVEYKHFTEGPAAPVLRDRAAFGAWVDSHMGKVRDFIREHGDAELADRLGAT